MPSEFRSSSLDSCQALVAPLLREPVERYTLPNGLTVLLKPSNGAAICSAQVWVKTGSVHEGAQLGAGLSHYLEHMLFKGTPKREGREISETVQAAGGHINAYTTFDRTVYYIDIPSENVETALDILGDVVFNSTLPAAEVEKEREVILREIDMGEDDPDNKLYRALFESAFRQHSFRYPIIGYKEVFSSVKRDDLVRYYNERYVPNNIVLVLVGDYQPASVKRWIAKHFGAAERRALAPVYQPEEPVQLANRSRVETDDVQVTRLGLGFQTPGLTHPDTPILDVLSLVLGNGQSSLLNVSLREKSRLVHAIDATNWTPGGLGLFYLSILCDPDKKDASIAEAHRFINALSAADFTEAVVAKAVRQALVAEVNARKTVSGQASRLGAAEVVVGDIGYAGNYLKRVSEVTGEDLARVLKTWLRWDRLTTVSLEPKNAKGSRASKAKKAASSQDFSEKRLSNGARVLLRHDARLPNLHFRVALQAGSLFEKPGQQGLTSLFSTMLTKDTASRTAEEVAEAIEGAGGNFYEFSGNNSMGLALEVLPTDADLALNLIEEALLRPTFVKSTFALEKESQLAGIKESMDDVVSLGRRQLRELFFGKHPFRIGGSGSLATVGKLTVKDARALYEKLIVSGNVVLAVSGQFDEKNLLPKLEALLKKLPKGKLADGKARFKKPHSVGVHRKKVDRQQAVVFHAYPGPGLKAADFIVSDVADELFSGMSSNLFERVREELSLAYFVRSSRLIGLDTAMFYFYAGASPERYQEVIAELLKETQRVKDGLVEPDELARCQTRLKAANRMGRQTNSACAGQASLNAVYGLPVNEWRDYDAKIDAVTIADLQAFAKKYFDPKSFVELVIGKV